MLLALLLAFPVSSSALPSATDFSTRCQGEIPLRSPEEVFKAHNITLATACPIQSSVDDKHECQDTADSLQDLFVAIKSNRTVACKEASAAAAKAQQDCQGQSTCVSAQAAAVKSFQTALQTEIAAIKKYVAETDKVLKYANDAIAGGGVEVVRVAKLENAKNPEGKDGTAGWLKADSNQDAVKRVLADEDESNARSVVGRFLKDGARLSDITSIRSNLIREPLQLVSAGTEWRKELVAYQAQEEGKSNSLAQQAATLKTSGTNLADNSGVSGNGNNSPISASGDGVTAASKAATSAGQLGSITQGGTNANGGSVYDPGTPSAASGSAPAAPRASAANGTYFSGNGSSQGEIARASGSALPGTAAAAAQTVAALVPSADAVGVNGKTSSTGSSSSLRSQLAARLAAHGSASSGGDGAKNIDSRDSSRALASATASGGNSAASAEGGTNGGGGTGEIASSFTPALIPVASESNENAVKGIVGAWEKSLAPDGAVATSPETLPGAGSEPLFGRVRLAHERALRRGSIQRTLAPKL
jgi:hypothetical protein